MATEKGEALLATGPARIDVALLMQEPEFREFYRSEGTAVEQNGVGPKPVEPAPSRTTPEEQIDAAHAALQAALRDELLQRILANSPAFFEQVIVDLLIAMGYGGSHKDAAAQLGRTGDGGVDGIVNEDRLGLDRIYIQAKRYAPGNPVGRPARCEWLRRKSRRPRRHQGRFRHHLHLQPASARLRQASGPAGHSDRRPGAGGPDDRARRRRSQLPHR